MNAKSLTTAMFLTFCLAAVAGAAPVTDPPGDFLATYTAGPQNPDLDVVSAEVVLNPGATLAFSGTLAGPVGTTPGALYAFGLDRGAGTEGFQLGTPPIGDRVFFDSVLALDPAGAGQFIDLITGVVTPLSAGSVVVEGSQIRTGALPLSLFPAQGAEPEEFTWTLWPRLGLGANNQVSDFAPDFCNAPVTVIPAPGAAVLVIAGTVLAGCLRRRRAL
jgi:hypothetical protein